MLAFSTPHVWLLVVSLLVALVLLLLWTRGWFASRMDDTQRDTSSMIDPAELRRLREVAEARKAAALAAARDGEPQA
ncbi:ABC-type Fe3+ transport system permease subunit [Xanthomonas arboricola]